MAELVGARFGRLTVLGPAAPIFAANGGRPMRVSRSLCRCECGQETVVRNHALKAGKTKSCGCLARELGLEKLERLHQVKRSRKCDFSLLQSCMASLLS